jgi:multidrug efflux system outer membrane protein
MNPRALVPITALALGACMVGPDYERPAMPLPGAFAGPPAAVAAVATDSVPAEWWRLFGDPTLDELVATALANNTDIVQAVARIEQADANVRVVNAALFPQLNLGGTGGRTAFSSRVVAPEPPGELLQNNLLLELSASFEIDFWGKLRRASEAARAQDLSTRYAKDVVTLSTAALTTQTYFALRSLDAQIASTRSTLDSREDTLAIVRRRADAGLASDLDVRQAEGARSDAAFQLDDFLRQRDLAEHLPTAEKGLDGDERSRAELPGGARLSNNRKN